MTWKLLGEKLTENGHCLALLDHVAVQVVVGRAGDLHLAEVDVDSEAQDAGGHPAALEDGDLKTNLNTEKISFSRFYFYDLNILETVTSPLTILCRLGVILKSQLL